jgi:hypothetical protein
VPSTKLARASLIYTQTVRQRLSRVHTQQRQARFLTFTQITSGLLGDINGTGLPSFVLALASTTGASSLDGAYFGNGGGWNVATSTIYSPPLTFGVGTDCTDSQLVDLTGDGLADWLYTDGTSTYVYLNNGNGWQSATDTRWTLPFSLVYKSGGNCYDRGIRFVDVNGDGLPDVIHEYNATGSGGLPESGTYQTVYLNTGEGWATSTTYTLPYVINNPTGASTTTYQELANFYGNGQQYQDVLTSITYPKGGSTNVTYGYTTEMTTNPQLPYNLLVVTAVINHNGIGSSEETDYTYTGGRQYCQQMCSIGNLLDLLQLPHLVHRRRLRPTTAKALHLLQ